MQTPNLISRLHSTSGFGVRPAAYSRRKCVNTRSRYSAAKLTRCSGISKASQVRRASWKSAAAVQYASSSSSQLDMYSPCTEWPARLSSSAATAESTPPDMPTMTVPGEPESVEAGRIRQLYRRGRRGGGLGGARPARPQESHQHL